jgi:hypothetical protein
MTSSAAISRSDLVRQGQRLEYFTIVYNSLEGFVSILPGLTSGSVSPVVRCSFALAASTGSQNDRGNRRSQRNPEPKARFAGKAGSERPTVL